MWVTDTCRCWGAGGSVRFWCGINIEVTRVLSVGLHLSTFLLLFLKQQINSNMKPGRVFGDLHPKHSFFVWFFVPPFIPSLTVRSMNSFMASSGVPPPHHSRGDRACLHSFSSTALFQSPGVNPRPDLLTPCDPRRSFQIAAACHSPDTNMTRTFVFQHTNLRRGGGGAESIVSSHETIASQQNASPLRWSDWINKSMLWRVNMLSAPPPLEMQMRF